MAVHYHLHVLERGANVGVEPVVALEKEFPVLSSGLDIGAVVAVESTVAPHVGLVAKHDKLGIAHGAVLEVDFAMLHGSPPVALVACGVVGLVELIVDALSDILLQLLELAQLRHGVLLHGVLLLGHNRLLRSLSPREGSHAKHEH